MNRSGRVWFLAVLCAGVGCAQVDEPAAPEANPAQAAPEVAQAGDAPEAEPAAESSPAAAGSPPPLEDQMSRPFGVGTSSTQ